VHVDMQVPLLRSEVALEKATLKLMDTIGAAGHTTVWADCGLEQEFFLVRPHTLYEQLDARRHHGEHVECHNTAHLDSYCRIRLRISRVVDRGRTHVHTHRSTARLHSRVPICSPADAHCSVLHHRAPRTTQIATMLP